MVWEGLDAYGTFQGLVIGHFLSYAPAYRPLLLLLDGHSSHFCSEDIRAAAAEDIIIFTLSPHTTQLLDKSAFAPLKVEWRKVVQDFFFFQRIQAEMSLSTSFLL